MLLISEYQYLEGWATVWMTSTSLVTTSFCRLQWFCWIIVCHTTVDWWLQFWTERLSPNLVVAVTSISWWYHLTKIAPGPWKSPTLWWLAILKSWSGNWHVVKRCLLVCCPVLVPVTRAAVCRLRWRWYWQSDPWRRPWLSASCCYSRSTCWHDGKRTHSPR